MECHYTKRRHTKCCALFIVMMNAIMVSVIMLNVVAQHRGLTIPRSAVRLHSLGCSEIAETSIYVSFLIVNVKNRNKIFFKLFQTLIRYSADSLTKLGACTVKKFYGHNYFNTVIS